MNVTPAPALTRVKSSVPTPLRTANAWVRKSVDEPGLVIPSRRPLKSAGVVICPASFVETTSTSPGTSANCTTLSMHLPLACRSTVWS